MAFDGDVLQGVELPRWHPGAGERPNFGDELGPLLVRAIRRAHGDDAALGGTPGGRRLLSIGSVMHFARPGDAVWGAGVNGKVAPRFAYPLDVRAVRGPYTRAVLLGHGVDVPEVYGDPALLIPRLRPDLGAQAGDAASEELVVPNLNDLPGFDPSEVLDPRAAPAEIVSRVAGASFVIASSLHALIIADAFGVPSRPLLSDAEHPFKYVDYYAGTGRQRVRFASSVAEARDLGPIEPAEVDADALLEAFPHDLWDGGAEPSSPRAQRELVAAAMSALGGLAQRYERTETVEEARTMTRAMAFIGDQDELAAKTIAYAAGEGSTAEAARFLFWFLRKGPVADVLDARVSAAVRECAPGPVPTRRDEILWRLVGACEMLLAREIARDRAALAEGEARARALGLLPQDDAQRAPVGAR